MTAFQSEGCGIALWGRRAARVQKVQRVAVSPSRAMSMKSALRGRVLKFDGPSGRGLWIALRAIFIKSALRDNLAVSYGMISILLIGSLRSPPPIRLRRTFHLKVKRLTMICASLALLQIMFAVHPRESVSHDSQVALLPYESCSLATPVQGAE